MNWKKAVFILALVVFLVYITLNHLVYIGSSSECAKFIGQGQTKGANYIKYEFNVANKKYIGSETTSRIVDLPMDSLEKIPCIKVEFSNISPYFNRIIDPQVLK